jgi:hypothetical protein
LLGIADSGRSKVDEKYLEVCGTLDEVGETDVVMYNIEAGEAPNDVERFNADFCRICLRNIDADFEVCKVRSVDLL